MTMVWNLLSSIIRPLQRLVSVSGQDELREERTVHRLKSHHRLECLPAQSLAMTQGRGSHFISPGECANLDVMDSSFIIGLPSAARSSLIQKTASFVSGFAISNLQDSSNRAGFVRSCRLGTWAGQRVGHRSKHAALTTSKFFSLRGHASERVHSVDAVCFSEPVRLPYEVHWAKSLNSPRMDQKQSFGREISVAASSVAVSTFSKMFAPFRFFAAMSPWLIEDIQLHATECFSRWFSSPRLRGPIHGSNITSRLSCLRPCGDRAGVCFL